MMALDRWVVRVVLAIILFGVACLNHLGSSNVLGLAPPGEFGRKYALVFW
jgi:hypothetical protein